MAMEAGVPVVPITIVGSYEAWPKGKFALRPEEVVVNFHSPIDPHKFVRKEELLIAVHAAIESGLSKQYQNSTKGEPASH
jgi:1-acyl-sn-glycerol-3-phosphate acyltransferase